MFMVALSVGDIRKSMISSLRLCHEYFLKSYICIAGLFFWVALKISAQ